MQLTVYTEKRLLEKKQLDVFLLFSTGKKKLRVIRQQMYNTEVNMIHSMMCDDTDIMFSGVYWHCVDWIHSAHHILVNLHLLNWSSPKMLLKSRSFLLFYRNFQEPSSLVLIMLWLDFSGYDCLQASLPSHWSFSFCTNVKKKSGLADFALELQTEAFHLRDGILKLKKWILT